MFCLPLELIDKPIEQIFFLLLQTYSGFTVKLLLNLSSSLSSSLRIDAQNELLWYIEYFKLAVLQTELATVVFGFQMYITSLLTDLGLCECKV